MDLAPSQPGTTAWAAVTGASDGIGRALALELGNAGYAVLAFGRSPAKLDELRREWAHRSPLETVVADFGQANGLSEFEQAISGRRIEVFAPAAGFGTSGLFSAADRANELAMVDVNCRAVVAQVNLILPGMIVRGGGQVVLFSSILGTAGAGTSAVYAATKNFIHAFAEGLRSEVSGSGVQILTVCPGPTTSSFATTANMRYSAADSAASVGRGIARRLARGGSGVVYPAPFARLLGWSMALAPRPLRVRILSRVMAGLSAH